MKICFKCYQDDYAHLNGCKDMKLKKIDLCRHTMQVGYRNRTLFLKASIYKHLELLFMVMANVDYVNGHLKLKDEYFALDQSEKVCISYQIGQGLTKAVAEKYFKVPWVAHVKTMKNMNYKFKDSGSRKMIIDPNEKSGKEPDLIGFDKSNKAHLFESKGSSLNYAKNKSTIQRAINQVSNYVSFSDPIGNKQSFESRNACLFNFTPYFHGLIIDPSEYSSSDENPIGLLHCLYNYYNLFFRDAMKELEIIEEFGQKWSGYIFSLNDEKYFWGLNSLYKDFLQEQFIDYELNNKDYLTSQNKENSMIKIKRILNFFGKQESFSNVNDNDFVSIGEDGYILCNLNKF